MKQTFYFSHDANARSDEKIIKLRAKHGAAGYGVFFMLIEMLQQADKYQLRRDYEAIAFEIREPKELIQDVVENFNLLETNENFFWSESLKRRMKTREKIGKKRQAAGRKGGLAKARGLLKQNSSKTLARKGKERKKIISKEIEVSEKKEYGDPEINTMLKFFKVAFGLTDFKESQKWQRIYGKHLCNLSAKLKKAEFKRRVEQVAADPFIVKQCNSIKTIYEQIKSAPDHEKAAIKGITERKNPIRSIGSILP